MKITIIVNSYLVRYINGVRLFFRLGTISGITLYPYILLASETPSRTLVNHEIIHCLQIQKHGFLFFYLHYFYQFIKNLFAYRSINLAYSAISYEREAYRLQYKDDININDIS